MEEVRRCGDHIAAGCAHHRSDRHVNQFKKNTSYTRNEQACGRIYSFRFRTFMFIRLCLGETLRFVSSSWGLTAHSSQGLVGHAHHYCGILRSHNTVGIDTLTNPTVNTCGVACLFNRSCKVTNTRERHEILYSQKYSVRNAHEYQSSATRRR